MFRSRARGGDGAVDIFRSAFRDASHDRFGGSVDHIDGAPAA